MKNEEVSRRRYLALDGLRGLGCIFVMLAHTHYQGRALLPGAVVMMDMFFAMSAFLITKLLLEEYDRSRSIDLYRFWQRRAMRLLPTFYIFVCIECLVWYFTRIPMMGSDPELTIISTAFYFSNWVAAFGHELGVFAMTWSLSIEEQFYFLWPLLFVFLMPRFNPRTVFIFLVVAVVSTTIHRYLVWQSFVMAKGPLLAWKRCFFGTDTHLDAIIIGCTASLLWWYKREATRIHSAIAWLCFGTFMIFVFYQDLPTLFHINESSRYIEFLMSGGWTFITLLIMTTMLFVINNPSSVLAKLLSAHWLVVIGSMSYSLYLWHPPAFGLIDMIFVKWDHSWLWLAKICMRFALAFLLGALSYHFTEKAALKWRKAVSNG